VRGVYRGGLHAGEEKTEKESNMAQEKTQQKLTLGAGCFWCTEAVFARLDGVTDVEVGYMGGEKDDPTYQEVCSGRTGHAEGIRITYDPTQRSQQGPDVGEQYPSAILTTDPELQRLEGAPIRQLDDPGSFPRPMVTTVEASRAFFPAEPYHQDFVCRNPLHPYVPLHDPPKLERFRASFPELLR
jgi:peptide-methionine (S)-S-oxide reductase